MTSFQILDFDSDLFGFGVAKILPARLKTHELKEICSQLKSAKIKLVYWYADREDKTSNEAALLCNGFLASEQITYAVTLSNIMAKVAAEISSLPSVSEYQDLIPQQELNFLALQAGSFSRFKMDPKLDEQLFIKLYNKWILNSVNKTIARKVLVVKQNLQITGMITLGEKNKRGDIGLLAVAKDFRGQNIGKALVRSAQKEFFTWGLKGAQVVTQLANKPACHLYEKCGFSIESIENVYHFWLE
jgi:dTDP-4-amino-4,6-dideoxy-D-galactose acyltransferase